MYFCSGEMAEWSIAAVLKTVVQQCTGGSNPSFSAEVKWLDKVASFFISAKQNPLWIKIFLFRLTDIHP